MNFVSFLGRPIVKGGGNSTTPQQQFHYGSNVDFQQQQHQQQQPRVGQAIFGANSSRPKPQASTPTGLPPQFSATQTPQPLSALIGSQRQSDSAKQMRTITMLQEELVIQRMTASSQQAFHPSRPGKISCRFSSFNFFS